MNDSFKIAMLGCGTVGGGVARILLDAAADISTRAGRPIELCQIIVHHPANAIARHGVPLALFPENGRDLTDQDIQAHTKGLLQNPDIELVVEAVGGCSAALRDLYIDILRSGKHLVSANKALLATYGDELFRVASESRRTLSFEAAVCGAIPIIRVVKDGFAGDVIESLSGIMNGTSNYILTKMREEGLSFESALTMAQREGYAEADPTLDIGGGDAGHKLAILVRLAFGATQALAGKDAPELPSWPVHGIREVSALDIRIAQELDCAIKLICYAERGRGSVHAGVMPMMVKASNVLSKISGAQNAVRFLNRYAGQQLLVGKGAGSSETGSSVVADIVALARCGRCERAPITEAEDPVELRGLGELPFPYTVIFDTEDEPGVTGIVTTAIGDEGINIDTVGHNLHEKDTAIFCVETMPCTRSQLDRAIASMRLQRPGLFRAEPKIYPILR